MPNEPVSNDVRKLWQNQTSEPISISTDELRKMAAKLTRRTRFRNIREYVAALCVIAAHAYYLYIFRSTVIRIGSFLTIAGVLLVVYLLHKTGSAATVPGNMALNACLDFYQAELERQRDLLSNVWLWYILPLVPGTIVFLLGLYELASRRPGVHVHHGHIAVMAVVCAIIFVFIAQLNRWAARKFQKRIDMLEALRKQP